MNSWKLALMAYHLCIDGTSSAYSISTPNWSMDTCKLLFWDDDDAVCWLPSSVGVEYKEKKKEG